MIKKLTSFILTAALLSLFGCSAVGENLSASHEAPFDLAGPNLLDDIEKVTSVQQTSTETPPQTPSAETTGAAESFDTVFSDAAYLVNTGTGEVVYAKNEFKRHPPASTAKIMTAILTIEKIPDLTVKTKVPKGSLKEFYKPQNPNFSGIADCAIEEGQDITYLDLLYGLMLPSGCDAGNVLAVLVSGTKEDFAEEMTEKAKELGCENTNFTNAHGLYEEENYTCAYDLYLIAEYATEKMSEKHRELFNTIASSKSWQFPPNSSNPDGYTLRNSNRLIRTPTPNSGNIFYFEGAKGIKTGSLPEIYRKNAAGEWIEEPGICTLASNAERGGENYLCTTLGAPYYSLFDNPVTEEDERNSFGGYSYKDHIRLYELAFNGE